MNLSGIGRHYRQGSVLLRKRKGGNGWPTASLIGWFHGDGQEECAIVLSL